MNINNASIIYYAIRDKETGDYLLFEGGHYKFGSRMCFINYFFHKTEAQDFINEELNFVKDKLEVRKMKIIVVT